MWLSEKIQMRRPIQGGCREEANRKSELLLWFREKKNSPKEQNGFYFKLISQLRLLSQNDCSLGRNVILNKEMEAETGTHPTSGRGSSGWPDLRGPKPLGGVGQLRKPGRSGQPG